MGRYIKISTSFGLNVTYDGNAYLQVALLRKFSEKIEGRTALRLNICTSVI